MPNKNIKRIISESSVSLLLVKGKDSWGHEYNMYLMMKNSMLAQFQKDYAEKPVDISQYGKVIFGTFGEEHCEETEQKVLKLFKTNYLKH